MNESSILIRISIESQQEPDTPFWLTFEVLNQSNEDIYFLKQLTPLEGLFSDCFEIKRDGELLSYDGPLVKRGSPTEEDYILIQPSNSVTIDVDLSTCYQISRSGKYEVAFRGYLPDVLTNSEFNAKAKSRNFIQTPLELEIPKKEFTVTNDTYRRETSGEAARHQEPDVDFFETTDTKEKGAKTLQPKSPNITGGTSAQQTTVRRSHNDGFDLTVAALNFLGSSGRYKEWFGSQSTERFNKVNDTYSKIRDGMNNKTFTYDLTGSGCESNWYAYTYKNSTKIWMCNAFWNAPPSGIDSQAGTVLHEHSHATASTDDIRYGQANCRELAKNNPDEAVKNADSYEYYAEEIIPIELNGRGAQELSQQWDLEELDNGRYVIWTHNRSRAMDNRSGIAVTLEARGSQELSQQWDLEELDNDRYVIWTHNRSRVMDVPKDKFVNAVSRGSSEFSQQWDLEELDNGCYVIWTHNRSRVMDVP